MIDIKLSVHELVDFVLRKGDIDTRVFNSTTMQEGTRLHNIYQSIQGSNYQKEVSLIHTFIYGTYAITLQGRCDGLIKEKDEYVLKNIKLSFELGKSYAIRGKSGSGKTTLLSLISGLEKKYEGEILYDGKNLAKMNLDKYRNNDECLLIIHLL